MRRLAALAALVAACGSHDGEAPRPAPRDASSAPPVVIPRPAPPPFDVAAPADKLVAVGRGERRACVVRASGAVDCWGDGDPSVRRVAGVTDAIGISADASCVIRATGQVACLAGSPLVVTAVEGVTGARWADPHGRCFVTGAGAVTCLDGERHAWKVPNVADAISLASGDLQVCAVRKTGQVTCGSSSDQGPWSTIEGLEHVRELAVAGLFGSSACAAFGDQVRCFPLPSSVDPGARRRVVFDDAYQPVTATTAAAFAGATHLALTMTSNNQLELEAVVGGKIVVATADGGPRVIPHLADAAGHVFGCAIRAQGSLVCWGNNTAGVLAQPTTIGQRGLAPRAVVGLGDVVDLALGLTQSFALTRDGTVWRWGRVDRGAQATPAVLPLGLGPSHLVQLTADRVDHVCMRSAGGEVWCQTGELGGRIEQLDTEHIVDLQPYGAHVLALRADGRFEEHAISDERGSSASLEVTDFGTSELVQIGDMQDAACGRDRAGGVRCPGPIKGLAHTTAFASGWYHRCAVMRGRVWCWTVDAVGAESPLVEIPGLRDVTDLASSAAYACAVHDHGKVSCWGYDERSTGSSIVRTWRAPVLVVASGAVDVELGLGTEDQAERAVATTDGPQPAGAYGCAILIDRTVTCWGRHLFGELGDGSFVDAVEPIGVAL